MLKPINQDRFSKTIEKVIVTIEKETSDEKPFELHRQIFIKDGENCWLIKISEIAVFEIVGNYTRVYFEDHKPLIYKSLNQIEANVPEATFFRANRQQIINLNHIEKVVPWFNGKLKAVMKDSEQEIEVSRRQSYKFKDVFGF